MNSTHPYLRQILGTKYNWIEERVHNSAIQSGYGHLSPALTRLFGHMRQKPVSISDLSRKLSISRQAVHKLLIEAKDLGYVDFIDDVSDKRLKLVIFTDKGLIMSKSAIHDLKAIEKELCQTLGEEDFNHLKRILTKKWTTHEDNK